MKLGNKIRSLRRDADMTQEDLAKRLGVSRSGLASWEVDRTGPKHEELEKLAEIFGVTISYLLGEENADNAKITVTKKHWDMLFKIASLDRTGQDFMEKALEMALMRQE